MTTSNLLPPDPAPSESPSRSVNLGEAFGTLFRDPRWQPKLGLLIVCGCIPGLNLLAWLGYQQSIANLHVRGSVGLPSWDDWADILVRGLAAVTASGVYALPGLLLILLGHNALIVLLIGLLCLLIGSLAVYAAHLRFAQTDQPGEYGLDGWRTRLRARQLLTVPAGIFMAGWLLQALILLIALILTPITLLTIIGVVIVWSLVSVVNGSLIGQAAAHNLIIPAIDAVPERTIESGALRSAKTA